MDLMASDDESALERDHLLFTDFYNLHRRPVLALAYTLSGSWAVAEDATQEAFARLYKDWPRVSAFERPDTWVRTVTVNLLHSRTRRSAAELKARLRLTGRRRLAQDDYAAAEYQHVWEAVRRLPHRQAEVVAFYYVDDRSVREVAELLGVAEGTVKALLHQARQALARDLGSKEK